jgi:dTDP-4-dehydrorhamnose 3,5-epimerase
LEIKKCDIEGVRIYNLRNFPDLRGTFFEFFRRDWLPDIFSDRIQINCSRSEAGVIRGLHYHQRQWDLWVPVSGRMTAGLCDLRKGSSTFKRSLSIELNDSEPSGLLIPPGVAHGFAASTELILVYVVNNYFDNTDEHGIAWNDPAISINWGIENPILSERDALNKPHDWE